MQKGQYFISIIILLNAFDFTIKTGVWPLLTTMLNIENVLRLVSLFPVSQSNLSTLQVLCPTMTKEDRETLVALATSGIINWQENDSENTHINTLQMHTWTFWT